MRRFLALSVLLSSAACSTAWKVESTHFQPVQSRLKIEANPKATVLINHRQVGESPLEVPVDYGKEVRLERRRSSYWITEPGWSLFLTLASLGAYLPFSLIPIDTESRLIDTGNFQNNLFEVEFRRDGEVVDWRQIEAKGEQEIAINQKESR
jgi:hypothetical protein